MIAIDFDGTILDSKNRHRIVMNAVLKEFSLSIDTSDMLDFKISKAANNIDYLRYKGIGQNAACQIQVRWQQLIEDEQYLINDILFPDTLTFLEAQKGKVFLLTARNNAKGLLRQVERLCIKQYFTEIFVVSSGQNSAFEKAQILISANACLMIGDTEVDLQAAKEAKVNFIAMSRGFRNKAFWLSKKIEPVDSLSNIIKLK